MHLGTRPRRLITNYEKHKNRKSNFDYVENNKRDRKYSRYPATFWFIAVFEKVHLKVSIGLDSNVVVDFSKQSFTPEEISVQNPEA